MMAPALIAALAVVAQAEDPRPWKAVVSQEGQFVVDFPGEAFTPISYAIDPQHLTPGSCGQRCRGRR